MPFDSTTRNRLARFVGDARALLTVEFTRQLQLEYGLDPTTGEVTDLEKLAGLDDARRETARLLRETMQHYLGGAARPSAREQREALERIAREQAFTVLNRLCALRMAEARGLLIESVGRGYQSKGFQLYARLAGTALGETGGAYQSYLFGLFDELALDLPVLFDRFSKQGRLFPRESALLQLLQMINHPEIAPLWAEDETVGWVYQYYNSVEERRQMRAESSAPRNSRELAVRNQFFTPRYVVEFLTDNTLGRIWYEMTQGETSLKDTCRYLVRRPLEVFLWAPDYPPLEDPPAGCVRARQGDFGQLPEELDWDGLQYMALSFDGYKMARRCGLQGEEPDDDGPHVLEAFADGRLEEYRRTGRWRGNSLELWMCLFFEQRRWRWDGRAPKGRDLAEIHALYSALRQALQHPPEDLSQEELLEQPAFIPFRPLKDPRDIKMLDPACGSMHFGLYAFDLYERIYEEAWELEAERGADALQRPEGIKPLREAYENKDAFLRDVPRLIIEHNLHGIDIDPRAVQIAGLSLWLRAQRGWQAQGIKPVGRPQIRRANIVCAEPMPGDRAMLEEYLREVEPRLRPLVRTIWEKMRLAGEAGSLLKIEEEIAEALEEARSQALVDAPPVQITLFEKDQKPQQMALDLKVSAEERKFWARAEEQLLAALGQFAERARNGRSTQRRFFAGDAEQGLAFIDVCRKSYDAVVMNPPFGSSTARTGGWLRARYPRTYSSLGTAFVQRMPGLLSNTGTLGVIVDIATSVRSSYARYRRHTLYGHFSLTTYVHLGWGVLDANVEICCFTAWRQARSEAMVHCIDAARVGDKGRLLVACTEASSCGCNEQGMYLVRQRDFEQFPNGVPNFTLLPELRRLFRAFPPMGGHAASVKTGLSSGDNSRFYKLIWEVPQATDAESPRWIPLANGGEFLPFYRPFQEVIDWKSDGEMVRAHSGAYIRNQDVYGQPGLSYGKRGEFLAVHTHPEGRIITNEGQGIFTNPEDRLYVLGLLNSSVCRALINEYCGQHKENGYVSLLPIPHPTSESRRRVAEIVSELVDILRAEHAMELEHSEAVGLTREHLAFGLKGKARLADVRSRLNTLERELDHVVMSLYGLSERARRYVRTRTERCPSIFEAHFRNHMKDDFLALMLADQLMGIVFGRWDVRHVLGEPTIAPNTDTFAAVPLVPPGFSHMNQDGGRGDRSPSPYGAYLCTTGILVDDEGSVEHLVRRIRAVLDYVWENGAHRLEQEMCDILGESSLDAYYRNPERFFAEHLARYSKTRRQAPIYWPLSTPSGSYTLWLYYHRLTDQTLYTCVNDLVEPKLKQVAGDVDGLRRKRERSGAEERDLERLAEFEQELKDLRDELLRVAAFWKPNLNDGVQITAAPLWRLFRHRAWQKRLKETWQKLEAGEYDWAHLAYSIWPERVREKCRHDRSLAIAHGLEDLYEEPPAEAARRGRRRRRGRGQ